MPILQGVEDSVTNANFKYFGELGLMQVSLQRDEAVRTWSTMNRATEGFMTRALRDFAEPNPAEAMSTSEILKSQDTTKGLDSAMIVALAQVLSKTSDNTPPQTGTQKV